MKHKKASVMIVDDIPVNLKVLCHFLEESKYDTMSAESGEDALNQLERCLPDIILLDIMMPGIDGFETCRRLKQNELTKDIPIIFITALSDIGDKVRGFRLGAVDYITKPFQQEEVLARINAHLTIRRQKKELAELNAMKDKLFSIIGHDMRGVFSSLLGFSGLLSKSTERFSQEQIENFAQRLHSSVQNSFNLLENLLNWAKIQRGMISPRPKKIDLRWIVNESFESCQLKAEQKNILLLHTIESGTFVYADPNMIDTIFRNLISNALKFTESGGEIKVSAMPLKEPMEISVSDTGIGISKENIQKLFKIDESCKTTGTGGEEGTGLGLILCKDLIEMHKGKIWVESELGRGSVFRFTLPKNENREAL